MGQNWSTYYFPDFQPAFEVVFTDPTLQQAADEMCGDDFFCRFDIATTESTDVGLSTLTGSQEFEEIVNNSRPSELTACIDAHSCTYTQCNILTYTYMHPCR